MPTLKAKAVGQTSVETVQEIGKKFMLGWTFQNTGEAAWPLDILFLRANGDEIESSPWHATHSLAVNDQVTILVEFTAPAKPGKYFACFRLTQGDNTAFGDKVFLNLTAKDPDTGDDIIIGSEKKVEDVAKQDKEGAGKETDDLLWRSQKMAENVDKFAEGEDLDNSIVIEGGNEASAEAGDKEEDVVVPVQPAEDKNIGSALIEEVPVLAVNVQNSYPYDYARAQHFLTHFDEQIEIENPGACSLLQEYCVDPVSLPEIAFD